MSGFRAVEIIDGETRIVGDILEKQLAKSLEVVIWEGERTVLGSLTTHERMSLERNADGVLEGGYRF